MTDGWDDFKSLKEKANSVPLSDIFKKYSVNANEHLALINCPFSTRHKGGRDRTPSFRFFSKTNSFYCYGCKTHGGAAEFMAAMDNIPLQQAMSKIISIFGLEDSIIDYDPGIDYAKRTELLVDFSDFIRDFIQDFRANDNAIVYIETATAVFDKIMLSKKFGSNENLQIFIEKCKDKINKYKSCQQL